MVIIRKGLRMRHSSWMWILAGLSLTFAGCQPAEESKVEQVRTATKVPVKTVAVSEAEIRRTSTQPATST